jgi:hypothetical protein
MTNAQQWLENQEKYNTKEKRQEIKELNINNQNLEGKLDLSDFVNLERINCSNNLLTDIDLTNFNSEKIKIIDLSNNNLSERDLTCFSKLVNLERLSLDTSEARRKEGKYNRFYGSLEPLRNLTKLVRITIDNTNIDTGLEYLPEVTGGIFTNCDSLSSSFNGLGCRKIYDELKDHLETYWVEYTTNLPFLEALDENNGYYATRFNLETWRIENVLTYRKSAREKLIKDNLSLQDQLNVLRSQFAREVKGYLKSKLASIETQMSELETTFEQGIKFLKSDWNSQIKNKKNEITNVLHGGKGSSAQLNKEIKKLQTKLTEHKKLTQQLQKARGMLSGTDLGDKKELEEIQNNLANFLQKIQKDDNTPIQKGNHRIIKEIKDNHEKIQNAFENIEKNREVELEKLISSIKKLTQKLLNNQQLETKIESPNN